PTPAHPIATIVDRDQRPLLAVNGDGHDARVIHVQLNPRCFTAGKTLVGDVSELEILHAERAAPIGGYVEQESRVLFAMSHDVSASGSAPGQSVRGGQPG